MLKNAEFLKLRGTRETVVPPFAIEENICCLPKPASCNADTAHVRCWTCFRQLLHPACYFREVLS